MKKVKETKSRVVEIPNEFNRQLKKRVIDLEGSGIITTVSELIIKYAQIGYKEKIANKIQQL